jgi:hypothetical protein
VARAPESAFKEQRDPFSLFFKSKAAAPDVPAPPAAADAPVAAAAPEHKKTKSLWEDEDGQLFVVLSHVACSA